MEKVILNSQQEVQDLLVNMYNGGSIPENWDSTNDKFDRYIDEYLMVVKKKKEDITQKEINNCAYHFVQYDNKYLSDLQNYPVQ